MNRLDIDTAQIQALALKNTDAFRPSGSPSLAGLAGLGRLAGEEYGIPASAANRTSRKMPILRDGHGTFLDMGAITRTEFVSGENHVSEDGVRTFYGEDDTEIVFTPATARSFAGVFLPAWTRAWTPELRANGVTHRETRLPVVIQGQLRRRVWIGDRSPRYRDRILVESYSFDREAAPRLPAVQVPHGTG